MRRFFWLWFVLILASQESGGAEQSHGSWRGTYWIKSAGQAGVWVVDVDEYGIPTVNSPLAHLTFDRMPAFQGGRQPDPDFDEIATWVGRAQSKEEYQVRAGNSVTCNARYDVDFKIMEVGTRKELEVTFFKYSAAVWNEEKNSCYTSVPKSFSYVYTKSTKPVTRN